MGKKLIWKKCLWLILSYVSCKFTPINHKRHFFNLFYQGCHNSGIDGMLYDWLHHLWTLIKQLFGKKKLIMNSGTTKQFSGRLYVWVCVQVFFIWFLFFSLIWHGAWGMFSSSRTPPPPQFKNVLRTCPIRMQSSESVWGTSLIPCRKGSELEVSALAEGGVGGTLFWMPTVARKQMTMAGIAYIRSCNSDSVLG